MGSVKRKGKRKKGRREEENKDSENKKGVDVDECMDVKEEKRKEWKKEYIKA